MAQPVRKVVGQRLAYYDEENGSQYWDEFWQKYLTKKWYARYEKGNLLFFEDVFLKYLPLSGRILEAGCGTGQMVMALRYRGYDCDGVEWAEKTVNAVQRLYPELPVRFGNITRLDVPDGCYDAYISLGVVEHRMEGPEPYLSEAYRILSTDGVMLLSVPFFSPLRQRQVNKGRNQEPGVEDPFSYYAFRLEEMAEILDAQGFWVKEVFPYDLYLGLKEELPLLKPIFALPHMSYAINTLLKHWKWGRQHLSHMVMFICAKK